MALTPAQRRYLQLKHLSVIVRAEAELRAAALATLAALAAVYADPESTPTDQSAAVTQAEDDVNNAWLALLLLLFRKRYDDAGGDLARRKAAEDEYADRQRALLHGVVAEVSNGGDPEMLATRVARTSVVTTYNAGAFKGLAGEAVTKMWLSLRDARVRPTHHEADGQAVPLQAKFTVGGHTCDYPGDPSLPPSESVNCRCVMTLEADLTPVVAAATPDELPSGWHGVMAPIGVPTGDGRMLVLPETGFRSRQMPLSLTLQHVGEGVDVPIGTVEHAWIEDIDGAQYLLGEGRLDLGSEEGAEYARRLHEGTADTVSITPDEVTFEQRFMAPDGSFVTVEEATEERDEDGETYLVIKDGYKVVAAMTDWRFSNLSAVSIPAFDAARISPVYGYRVPAELDAEDDVEFAEALKKRKAKGKRWPSYEEYEAAESKLASDNLQTEAVVAAAKAGQVFRAANFANPNFTGPTAPNYDPETGRYTAHVATFDSCYMGAGGGKCLKPPTDGDFSRFLVHGARLEDGSVLPVGVITFGEGHMAHGSLRASQAAYANISTAAVKVVIGIDQFGIWVSGEVIEEFRDRADDLLLAPLSGHWEPDMDRKGKLTLIAAHCVNTPGYAVSRIVASVDAQGEIEAVQFTGPTPTAAVVDDAQVKLRARLALRKLANR